MKRTILAVGDDLEILELIKHTFPKKEYSVLTADSAKNCLANLKETIPDLMLLDVELPDACGFDVCRSLKSLPRLSGIPIILLSGERLKAQDVSCGLEEGAVDYIRKPFETDELLARAKAVIVRQISARQPDETYAKNGIKLFIRQRRALINGKTVKLTAKEMDLLYILLKRSGNVVEKAELLNTIWDYNDGSFSHALESCMSRLKKKLGKSMADRIITVYGVGYEISGG